MLASYRQCHTAAFAQTPCTCFRPARCIHFSCCAAGCDTFPGFAPIPVTYLGNHSLCGRFAGTPFLNKGEDGSEINVRETTGETERPVPDASGACPAGLQVCGAPVGGTPNWDENRAICFDGDKPCPLRWLEVGSPQAVLNTLGVTSQGVPAVLPGDMVTVFNRSSATSARSFIIARVPGPGE